MFQTFISRYNSNFMSDNFIFFFQAEDGIRDKLVTGVQTCALPICMAAALAGRGSRQVVLSIAVDLYMHHRMLNHKFVQRNRSEERRVGKECRCRWWAYG